MSFGTLERNKNTKPISDINVTPMVDVMLVLLVIFIITAPLMVSSIKLDLPKTSAAQQSDESNFVTISIDKSGTIYLNDKAIAPAALQTTLEQRGKDQPDTEVQLSADTQVPYGRVIEVMGMAQNAGLKRIGFVADPNAAKTPNTAAAKPNADSAPALPSTPGNAHL